MVLQCQILFSLAIAAIAEAILMRTFAERMPFMRGVSPRYLKVVTSSNFWPSILISALMLFMLLVMMLLLSVLTSILCAIALSTSLVVGSLEKASLTVSYCCFRELSSLTVQEVCAAGVLI